jgi:hypothetical protein
MNWRGPKGRADIRQMIERMTAGRVGKSVPAIACPLIDVDGDRATSHRD